MHAKIVQANALVRYFKTPYQAFCFVFIITFSL